MVKSAALAFAPNEITVNAVAPGMIDTPLASQVMQKTAKARQITIEGYHAEMLADILGAASQEAGPSPVADALEALAAQVGGMEETQTGLIALVTALPEAIGRLTSLQSLSLGMISVVRRGFVLLLTGNYLTALPEAVGRLTRLQEEPML